jgi:hypothetical protein
MELIIGIALGMFVAVAIAVIVRTNRKTAKEKFVEETQKTIDPSCCGAHEVCEFDAVKVNVGLIEYFDDEELDKYAGVSPIEYSDATIDEFREVLYTLKTNEIQNWLLSLERRRVHLPNILKTEATELMASKD